MPANGEADDGDAAWTADAAVPGVPVVLGLATGAQLARADHRCGDDGRDGHDREAPVAVAEPAHAQWDIVPSTWPTLRRPTCPWSTAAKACETNG
jgi:hypothetical protein